MKIIDQLSREVQLPNTPKRVISVVPSITEMLYDFGVQPIAQTIFCIHPKDKFKSTIKIGGTKKLKIDKIRELQPDLVIANKEENLKEEVDSIAEFAPVYVSDIGTLSDAGQMIEDIGLIVSKQQEAMNLLGRIDAELKNKSQKKELTYLYLIWNDPFFVNGQDTFITDMLKRFDFKNAWEKDRYAEISDQEIRDLRPDILFLSSEPFPFKEKHLEEIQSRFPEINCQLIDGEMVSWYGSRIPDGLAYLREFRANLD